MNRLQLHVKRAAQAPRRGSAIQACSHTFAPAGQFYFAPLYYERNYSYPLLIWFHGPHNNENQLKQIMPLVSLRNYVGAAPRGTAPSEQDDGSRIRFCWRQQENYVEQAEQRLWECLDGARQRFNIASDRIFLAGLHCGGTMAIRLALRNPTQFAGALSFGGPFPGDRAPLARLAAVRRLPLFFATTAESLCYPLGRVCEHLRLYHSAGMSVTLRQYPGDDSLTKLMLCDMDRWIMERVTKAQSGTAGNLVEHHSTN
jgi:phospholipase/carboxylesterase